MAWKFAFEVKDGHGKIHKLAGVVPFDLDTNPPEDIFNYAWKTMFQSLMAEGPRCPGPFRVLDVHLTRA